MPKIEPMSDVQLWEVISSMRPPVNKFWNMEDWCHIFFRAQDLWINERFLIILNSILPVLTYILSRVLHLFQNFEELKNAFVLA
jgi:hypothetical protein